MSENEVELSSGQPPPETGMLIEDQGVYVEALNDNERDPVFIAWLEAKGKAEFTRLKSLQLTVLFFMPKNYGLVVDYMSHPNEKPILINRLEFSTGFDFDKVTEIKCSPPFSCRPHLPTYDYRHLLLSVNETVFIVVPYIYPQTLKWSHPTHGHTYLLKNKLDEWLFINSKYQRARLKVSAFN